MTVTALVAAAIAGMLGAVSSGVGTRKDNRTVMVLAHAAQSRLSAYLATSRCVLARSGGDVTLWLDDSRESGTVHASEIRWLRFDALAGALLVEYVSFPDNWSKTACELADSEYLTDADWEAARIDYQAKGLLASRALVDNLGSTSVILDKATARASRHVIYQLGFDTESGIVNVDASGTIRAHQTPIK